MTTDRVFVIAPSGATAQKIAQELQQKINSQKVELVVQKQQIQEDIITSFLISASTPAPVFPVEVFRSQRRQYKADGTLKKRKF